MRTFLSSNTGIAFIVILLLQPVLLRWQKRMNRLPSTQGLQDVELRRAFSHAMMWSMLTGACWGSLLWFWLWFFVCWGTYGFPPNLPRWLLPPFFFVPLVIGQVCLTLALHQPLRTSTSCQTEAGKS
jgi:hypothetical protein